MIKQGLTFKVPDGYHPNGASRQWRVVTVVSQEGEFVVIQYHDGEKALMHPVSIQRYITEGARR